MPGGKSQNLSAIPFGERNIIIQTERTAALGSVMNQGANVHPGGNARKSMPELLDQGSASNNRDFSKTYTRRNRVTELMGQ